MPSPPETRRDRLRNSLIDAAEAEIAAHGSRSLKARDLAHKVGCSVGAIYTHFKDMQALVLAVNKRTFRQLSEALAQGAQGKHDSDPQERLVEFGHAYLAFAAQNTHLWRALFDFGDTVPDWYLADINDLFAQIARPLAHVHPEKSRVDLDISVRALAAAVHGVVLLGLERRISALPVDQVAHMISELVMRSVHSSGTKPA
ncbi:MAG: TetR/AcrR family transcriptional regulator [Paracoccaceae bacterium]